MKKRILVLLIAGMLLLSACGSGEMAPAPAAASTPPPASAVAPPVQNRVATEAAEVESAEIAFHDSAPTDYFVIPMLTPSNAGDRRLVYTLNIQLQTTEFLPGMRLLYDTVAQAEGYLVTADVRGYDLRAPGQIERRASFRFRIPTEQLPEFILILENNYNIWGLQQAMEERTAAYQTGGWVLGDLRAEEALLLEAIEEAPEEEQAGLEERLARTRREIRELEAAQAIIMSDVIYSTVDIQLFEANLNLVQSNGVNSVAIAIALIGLVALFLLYLSFSKKRFTDSKR